MALVTANASAAESMRLLHAERSLYREVRVYESANERCMCFTRGCRIGRQTCVDTRQPDRIVMQYPRMMLGALYLQPTPGSVLIVGLGGGTLPRVLTQLFPRVHVDVVEIDPAVVRVARSHFGLRDDPRVRVHEMDGRVFVKRALRGTRRYDLIMLDAFDHEYIPEHLLTQQFIAEVKGLLSPGGVLAANTFSSSRLYDHESATYAAVFPRFYNLRADNRVILAVNGTLPDMNVVRANSVKFERAFARYGFTSAALVPLFSTRQTWNPKARVLTDQYSPANLLNR